MLKEIKEWLVAIMVAVVLIVIIRQFLFVSFTVDGISMDPTFEDGDGVVVNKFMDHCTDYERGDVIVFNYEKWSADVKGVLGTSGDTVRMEAKKSYVHGDPLS